MIATTQLRLALEPEEVRREKKYLDLIRLRLVFKKQKNSRNELTRSVRGTIFLVILF